MSIAPDRPATMPSMRAVFGNELLYGDNLTLLRSEIEDESVDLIYLDPPFNSQANYNLLFRDHAGLPGSAQAHTFEDTWHWGQEAARGYHDLVHSGGKVADVIEAMRTILGECDMLAYLVMMAPRLVELRRVLRSTGSLYLHCDPTAGHYLKLLSDAVFGVDRFRGEVVWRRASAHSDAKRWAPVHDTLLYYSKTATVVWNTIFQPYDPEYVTKYFRFDDGDGRLYWRTDMSSPNPRPNLTYEWRGYQPPRNGWRYSRETMQRLHDEGRIYYPENMNHKPMLKRYLDESKGRPVDDFWADIRHINPVGKERLGYKTQKPLALLERIISASSNPDDVVLDPFCGCGTAVDAAQKLGRRWIGMDVSWLAIDVIDRRLRSTYGESIAATYDIRGIPVDLEGAAALAERDKFEFERWAVSLVDAQPNNKQVGDKGIDGIARFATGPRGDYGRIIVSVKGGSYTVSHVRDLIGTVESHRMAMGILVALRPPTRGMLEAAAAAGVYEHPSGQTYPRAQIITVADLLEGKLPARPPMLMPYVAGDVQIAQVRPRRAEPRSQPKAAAG